MSSLKTFLGKIKFLAKYCVLIEQSLRTIPQTISIWNIESGPRIILIILHLQHMICDLIIISVSELVKTVAIKQVKIFLLQTRIWSHLLPLWHPSIFPVIIENKSSDSPVNQYLTGYVLCYEYILSTPSTICHVQVLHYDTNILWILIWTRWTFFRVKLVFERDFERSWSLGLLNPWDHGCLGPWDPWILGPWNLEIVWYDLVGRVGGQ